MQDYPSNPSSAVSRRQFLKASSLVAASAAVAVNFPSLVHAQAKQPINAVIIGVGGRGGGAGKNFLDAAKETGVEAKILAVADIVEAMASSRPYRRGLGLEVALREIEKQAGTELDAEVVRICLSLFREKGFVLPVSSSH